MASTGCTLHPIKHSTNISNTGIPKPNLLLHANRKLLFSPPPQQRALSLTITPTQIPGLVRRTYRYATGRSPESSAFSSTRHESEKPAFATSQPSPIEDYDDSRSVVKTLAASNASTYSDNSSAPAPQVHRHSNPFLHYSNPLVPGPSVYTREKRESTRYYREQYSFNDSALPPPEISRSCRNSR
jgi:hypothetical protein